MANDSSRVSLRFLNNALNDLNKSNERLSSGKRINRAADDAAGLAIAEALASQATVFRQASNNASYGKSVVEITDSALGQVSAIGTRLQELSAQSANGTLSDTQRSALNDEYQALTAEADRIAATTSFNGVNVFSGQSTSFQVGTDSSADSQINLEGSNLSSLLSSVKTQDISTQAGALTALDTTKSFVSNVSTQRGALGAASARLEVATNNIGVAIENIRSAESRIRDLDVASETANRTAANIRANSATSVIAQTKNLDAQRILKLLK